VNYDKSLVVTITMTCDLWAPCSGDTLFACGAISRPPQESSRDPLLRISVSIVLGFISVSKATCLGHKPIALRLWILQQYGFGKLLLFNVFLYAVGYLQAATGPYPGFKVWWGTIHF